MSVALAVLAALQGCGFGLVEDAEVDSAEPDGDVVIAEVNPTSGSTAGGTEVTIAGSGFDGEIAVTFGGVPARNVVKVDAATIVCETPSVNQAVTVDVKVVSELGEATRPGGFRFVEGEDPDTGGGDDSGDLPGDAMGGVVQFSLLQVACPACFGLSDEFQIWAEAAFHEETATSWLDWIPNPGTCVENPTSTAPSGPYRDLGDYAYLQAGSASVPLVATRDQDGTTYLSAALTSDDFPRNTSFDLSAQGGADGDAFTVQSALKTPNTFDSISPSALLYTQPNQAFSAAFPRSGASIYWSPPGGGEFLVVRLDVYNPEGTALVSTVVCTDADDGQMDIPGSALSSLPSGGLVAVYVLRYNVTNFSFPDGGSGEGASMLGVLGTAVIQ